MLLVIVVTNCRYIPNCVKQDVIRMVFIFSMTLTLSVVAERIHSISCKHLECSSANVSL